MMIIECGHPCIGLCGEPCPTFCRICQKDIVTEIFLGSEDEPNARYVQLEDCGHVFEFSDLDRWMDLNNDSAVKLKECPRCKKAIRRNLRYGNMIKQALCDIESVKRRMLGDDNRKYDLERSIARGLPDLHVKEARKIREYHSELTKGPFDENVLHAIDNQIKVLKQTNELKTKFEKDKIAGYFVEIYAIALEHLDGVRDFVLKKRRYFTTQETGDLSTELKRLSLLLTFMKYKERRRAIESTLSRQLSIDFMTVENYLTSGTKLTNEKINFIDKTLEELKTAIPLSGLAISDRERIEIVAAIGLSQGHWFKCPKGHIYAIGDCGQANQHGICPECKSRIGGMGRLQEGNTAAHEMTRLS